MRTTLVISALLLAACQAPVAGTPAEDACGASALEHLVGAPAIAAEEETTPDNTRIIRPGDAVTMDFNPERLNIEIDENERISRVYCS